MTPVLEALAPGFAEPVLATQACFRAVLRALSHPAQAVEMPAAIDALQRGPLAPAAAALLLTLLDADTPVHLHGALNDSRFVTWLRFHTGTRIAARNLAPFSVARADELDATLWTTLPLGTDDAPQDGATLVIEVPSRIGAPSEASHRLSLRGPGVPSERLLDVADVPLAFWQHRIALQAQFPRGIDVLLARGRELIGIPRSSVVTLVH